jgi:UDP-N-acetylmuramyl pentapeptide synthase
VAWFGLGTERSPGVRADDLELSGRTVSFRWDGGPRTTLRAAGRHQVYAALAAIAVGRLFGMDDREIRAGLERYEAPPMRCQVERLGGVTLINDAYNSNPLSARAALDLLCGWPATGRRVLVCGDMKELGDRAQEYHEQLGQEIARRGCIDRLVAVGPLSRYVADGALREGMAGAGIDCCDSADEAAQLVKTVLRDGDVVLLKGSRAIGLEQTAERLRETARLGRAA